MSLTLQISSLLATLLSVLNSWNKAVVHRKNWYGNRGEVRCT